MAISTAIYDVMPISNAVWLALNTIRRNTPELAALLEAEFNFIEVPRNTCLLQPGETARSCHFVLNGLVRSYHVNGLRQVTTSFMPQGHVVTSVHGFYGRQPTEEYIETVEDCLLAEMSYNPALPFREPIINLSGSAQLLLALYFNQMEIRMRLLAYRTPEERLRFFKTAYPGLLRRAPYEQVASCLGVSSRWLKKMLEDGNV